MRSYNIRLPREIEVDIEKAIEIVEEGGKEC